MPKSFVGWVWSPGLSQCSFQKDGENRKNRFQAERIERREMRRWRRRGKIRREKEARDRVSRGCASFKLSKLGDFRRVQKSRVSAFKER